MTAVKWPSSPAREPPLQPQPSWLSASIHVSISPTPTGSSQALPAAARIVSLSAQPHGRIGSSMAISPMRSTRVKFHLTGLPASFLSARRAPMNNPPSPSPDKCMSSTATSPSGPSRSPKTLHSLTPTSSNKSAQILTEPPRKNLPSSPSATKSPPPLTGTASSLTHGPRNGHAISPPAKETSPPP